MNKKKERTKKRPEVRNTQRKRNECTKKHEYTKQTIKGRQIHRRKARNKQTKENTHRIKERTI